MFEFIHVTLHHVEIFRGAWYLYLAAGIFTNLNIHQIFFIALLMLLEIFVKNYYKSIIKIVQKVYKISIASSN